MKTLLKKVSISNWLIFVGLAFIVVWGLWEFKVSLDNKVIKAIPPMAAVPEKHQEQAEGRLVDYILSHSERMSRRQATLLVEEALKTNKPLLILALMEHESQGYTPTSLSVIKGAAGAMGLGQVRWEIWGPSLIKAGIAKEKKDLWDIDTNVRATNLILDECLREANGDIDKVFKAYLGDRDNWYKSKINEHLANIYLAVSIAPKKQVEPEHKTKK